MFNKLRRRSLQVTISKTKNAPTNKQPGAIKSKYHKKYIFVNSKGWNEYFDF